MCVVCVCVKQEVILLPSESESIVNGVLNSLPEGEEKGTEYCVVSC